MKFNLDIENIKYIKITYKDNDGFSHSSKTSIKRVNEREIIAIAKFDDGLYIKTPQEIELSIASESGLYKAATQLKYIERDAPYVFFTIKTPDNMEYQQKREYFRVKLNENASITFVENEENINIACETFDISANGVRFILDKKIDLPQEVLLTIYFPARTITVNGKFIRVDNEDGILKASFRFDNLRERDLDYISQICLKKQLEQRRKNFM